MPNATYWKEKLQLTAHIEGGAFKEVYPSALILPQSVPSFGLVFKKINLVIKDFCPQIAQISAGREELKCTLSLFVTRKS